LLVGRAGAFLVDLALPDRDPHARVDGEDRRYSRRHDFANAAIAASRVGS
jgi:hypothetical protein